MCLKNIYAEKTKLFTVGNKIHNSKAEIKKILCVHFKPLNNFNKFIKITK